MIKVVLLRSGSRKGELPAIRRALVEKFVKEYGLSLAETARQLWFTTEVVSHMVRSVGDLLSLINYVP
ncbi:hypothetical protein [Prosthecochloris marina]|uniref:hypothetical protein n=1 Tax=Prosthecochloris marina TaxID=2017681 RepID=UPI0011B1CC6F|nr:hypothetical protein [Prosthecochloris marina]